MAISTEYWNLLILSSIEERPYEEQFALAEKCGGDIFKNWRLNQKKQQQKDIKSAGSDYDV